MTLSFAGLRPVNLCNNVLSTPLDTTQVAAYLKTFFCDSFHTVEERTEENALVLDIAFDHDDLYVFRVCADPHNPVTRVTLPPVCSICFASGSLLLRPTESPSCHD